MRRPCWCAKQWQNVAQVLHNNRIKFLKDFFRYCSVHQHGRRDVTGKPRTGLEVLFVLYHPLFRSPITDRVYKGTGSLPYDLWLLLLSWLRVLFVSHHL